MSDKTEILIVDDNATNVKLLERALEDDYSITKAYGGKEALKILRDKQFDVLLLDVNMPDYDGYKVCKVLRQSSINKTIPVIFISALTELNDKLKGYEAGGQDYIEKPVKIPELVRKVDLVISNTKEIEKLNQQVSYATQTAMTALTNNSEQGIIISFMEKSFKADHIHELLNALTDSISQYSIDSCVQIRTEGQNVNACTSSIGISRLENDLLEKAVNADRIVTLGKRGIFNSPRVSILVRNMPTDDDALYGRLVDHLAVIVVAADARCKHIEMQENKLGLRNRALDRVVEIADEEIEKIQDQFTTFREETRRIMSELHNDIEDSLVEFKMTESQEDHFYQILGQGENEVNDLLELGVVVEESLGRIKSTVTSAIENME